MLDKFFSAMAEGSWWRKPIARDVIFLNLQAITHTLTFNGGDTPVQGVMKDMGTPLLYI